MRIVTKWRKTAYGIERTGFTESLPVPSSVFEEVFGVKDYVPSWKKGGPREG